MHREHRHADVDHVDVEVRDELRDRSAAALVDLAELADLPQDVRVVERAADAADKFGVRIVRAALAAGARVLRDAEAPFM